MEGLWLLILYILMLTGHIVNLINGADLIPTLMQVCYAMATGYMLVIIFSVDKRV